VYSFAEYGLCVSFEVICVEPVSVKLKVLDDVNVLIGELGDMFLEWYDAGVRFPRVELSVEHPDYRGLFVGIVRGEVGVFGHYRGSPEVSLVDPEQFGVDELLDVKGFLGVARLRWARLVLGVEAAASL